MSSQTAYQIKEHYKFYLTDGNSTGLGHWPVVSNFCMDGQFTFVAAPPESSQEMAQKKRAKPISFCSLFLFTGRLPGFQDFFRMVLAFGFFDDLDDLSFFIDQESGASGAHIGTAHEFLLAP